MGTTRNSVSGLTLEELRRKAVQLADQYDQLKEENERLKLRLERSFDKWAEMATMHNELVKRWTGNGHDTAQLQQHGAVQGLPPTVEAPIPEPAPAATVNYDPDKRTRLSDFKRG